MVDIAIAGDQIEKMEKRSCGRCRRLACNKSLFASMCFNRYAEKASRKRKLINDAVKNRATVVRKMSFKLGLDRVQEVLVLALMLVLVFAVFYSNIELTYKIGTAVLVFSIIFLSGMACQAAKQEAEKRRF